jgi:ABC-type nitrate/sulfonate/bicarbonate transport system substrate-binding protein
VTVQERALPDDLLYYTRCPAPTATGLAVGLGLLAAELENRHGICLHALQDVTDEELRRRHFDHGITHLVREGGNIPALWAASRGAPTRLIGITWLDEYQAIVAGPSPAVRDLCDLAGRRIAVPAPRGPIVDVGRASTLGGFARSLATVGLDLSSVELVDTPPRPALSGPSSDGRGEHFDAELDLLASGQADAVWLKGAGGVAAVRQRGLVEVFRIDQSTDPLVRVNNGTPRTVTARQELIDEQPDLVRTYLEVLCSSQDQLAGDQARLWHVLSGETHQSAEDAERAYVGVASDSLVPSLAPERLAGLQDQADFLFAHGFIPNWLDVTSWSTDLFVPRAVQV